MSELVKVLDDFFYAERIKGLQTQVKELKRALAEAQRLLNEARNIQLTLVIDKTEEEIEEPNKKI